MTRIETVVGELREVVQHLRSELAILRGAGPHPRVARSALLSPPDVARMLDVSPRTLRRLRKDRRFPRPVRGTGRRPRWRYFSITRYLEGGK